MADINKTPFHLRPWVGFDYDGTLFTHTTEDNPVVGEPIKPMIERLKTLLNQGIRCKILTARVSSIEKNVQFQERVIRKSLVKEVGEKAANIEVTAEKDYLMMEFYDDRARQVIKDTGITIDGKE